MKYLKAVFCIFLVCFLFSGCHFKVSTSIDDLISPLSPFGDNADVKNALDAFTKGGYSLKMATAGDYLTSYIFYDLDGDSQEEALAFYETNDNLGVTQLAVICKQKDKWSVVESLKGEGREVHSVDFADLDGDSREELLVCWDVISKSTNHELCIYGVNDGEHSVHLQLLGEPKTVNSFTVVDMTGNGKEELLLFEINSGAAGTAQAELFTLQNGALQLLGSTKMDAHITSYDKISVDSNGGRTRVFADALKSDGASMLTEILIWSNLYGKESIISPYYSYATGLTADTTRNVLLYSMDINGNERIDVPLDYPLVGLPEEVGGVNWCEYVNSVLVHSEYALFAKNDGYILILPQDGIDRVRIRYDKTKREMTVVNKESKKVVCTVMPVLKATYAADNYPQYQPILESAGYMYLARQGEDADMVLSASALKDLIKAVN